MRLASALAAIALSACATSPADDSGAPGDHGGKADDDTCDSTAYGTWLTNTLYKKLTELGPLDTDAKLEAAFDVAGTKPCTTGADADFALWWGPFDARIKPLIDRIPHGGPSAATSQFEWDSKVTAAAPTTAEKNMLMVLAMAKPFTGTKAAYGAWVERYDQALNASLTGAGSSTAIFEYNGQLNDAEKPIVEGLELAQIDSTDEGAYAVWFAKYEPWHKRGFDTLGDYARNFTSRMAQVKPTARKDIDFLTYIQWFDAKEKAIYTGVDPVGEANQNELTWSAGVRPRGLDAHLVAGGSRSYSPWFSMFIERFSAALGSDAVITDVEKARLERFLLTKPCTTNLDTDLAPWNHVNEHRTNFGAAVEYFDGAKPEACI